MRLVGLAVVLASLSISPALADNPAPPPDTHAAIPATQRIKGVIGAYDPATETLSIAVNKLKTVSVKLGSNPRIIYNQKRKVAEVKAGDLIGAVALKGADGKLRAQQVIVFPPEFRGIEGQVAAGDANSNRVMINATVSDVTSASPTSGTLKVSFHGATAAPDGSCTGHPGTAGAPGCTGEAEIAIAPGVPVIALMPGDESLLVAGSAVSLVATIAADGTMQATRLTVEKDGIKPIL